MYNYLIDFRPVLLGAPLKLGVLSARLVRLWVNPSGTAAVVRNPACDVDTFNQLTRLDVSSDAIQIYVFCLLQREL